MGDAVVLDGKRVAGLVKDDVRARVERLVEATGRAPVLATLLVGDDPASVKYVDGKHRDCREVGIGSVQHQLPLHASMDDVLACVDDMNNDDAVTGYIVQLPLPRHLDSNTVIDRVNPAKDADGLHPYNLGELLLHPHDGVTTPLPCTPKGVIRLLEEYHINLNGANVCVVGRGVTIGRVIGPLLTMSTVNATVDLCHTGTRDLAEHTRRADIIVSATGRAGLITPDMIRDGAVLVDVGVNRVLNPDTGKYVIRGDFDHACYGKASAYTPNPGGVGPMTRAMLLDNVTTIAEQNAGLIP